MGGGDCINKPSLLFKVSENTDD